jgi:rhodanese-related sulfurtransferase
MVRGSNVARVFALIVLGAGAAALTNLTASTQRKLAWVGSYPRALDTGEPTTTAPPSPAVPTSPVSVSPTAAPAVSASPAAPPAALEPDLAKQFPPHPDKAAVEIPAESVEQLHDRKALFLDARRSSVYAEGHIPGARSFPVWESDIDARVKALYEEGLDQRAPVVIYCSGGNCEDSHMLAEKLYMVGFDNVLIYKDGFPDWQKRRHPVATGANP